MHNEWRGTFDEFEEAVEFGELDLFLRIDTERAEREAQQGIAPAVAEEPPPQAPAPQSSGSKSNGVNGSGLAPATSGERRPSKHEVKLTAPLAQPRAPSNTAHGPVLPTAASGSAKRKSGDADALLKSLGLSELSLTEEELNEILDSGKPEVREAQKEAGISATSGEGKYPAQLGKGAASQPSKAPVQRTYIPSAEAGVKPLRLAKMGSPTRAASESTAGAPIARYNAAQTSSKALAAEAKASTSSRAFSSAMLRDATSQGEDLKKAMLMTREASNTDRAEQVVGREDIDNLMASLGLGDVNMSDEEAEAFLFQGTIPTGMASGGKRLGRSGSETDRIRDETAARHVASRAKEKGYGSDSSRRSSVASASSGRQSNGRSSSGSASAKDTAQPKNIAPAPEKEDAEDTAATSSAEPGDQTTFDHGEEDAKSTSSEPRKADLNDKAAAEATPRTRLEPLPEASMDTMLGKVTNEAPEAGDIEAETFPLEPSERSKESIDAAEATKVDAASEVGETVMESIAQTPAKELEGSEEEETDVDPTPTLKQEGFGKASQSKDTTAKVASPPLPPTSRREGSIDSLTSILNSAVAPPPPEKALPSPAQTPASQARPPTMQLDSSLAALASQINFGDLQLSDLPEEGRREAPKSAPVQHNNEPLSPDSRQSKTSVSVPPSPADQAQSREEPYTPVRAANMPPNSSKQGRSSSMRRHSPSSSSGRRRAIDVQRSAVPMSPQSSSSSEFGSPSLHSFGRRSNTVTSPVLSSKPSIGRSGSQLSEMTSLAKTPSQKTHKKLFGLGRRREGSKKGHPSVDEESDEDIPTTFESVMTQSSSNGSAGSATDRSQKTLSVILREADEALSGLGDDDEGGSGKSDGGDDASDDGMSAFHLELDDSGAIQARHA